MQIDTMQKSLLLKSRQVNEEINMTNLHLLILLELSINVGNIVQDDPPVCEVNESNTSNSTPDRQRGNPGQHDTHEQTMKKLYHY